MLWWMGSGRGRLDGAGACDKILGDEIRKSEYFSLETRIITMFHLETRIIMVNEKHNNRQPKSE